MEMTGPASAPVPAPEAKRTGIAWSADRKLTLVLMVVFPICALLVPNSFHKSVLVFSMINAIAPDTRESEPSTTIISNSIPAGADAAGVTEHAVLVVAEKKATNLGFTPLRFVKPTITNSWRSEHLSLSQVSVRAETYGASARLTMMPSSCIWQAAWSICAGGAGKS